MTTALFARALSKSFDRPVRAAGWSGLLRSYLRPQRQRYDAVCGLDFDVEEGASLALIGPNGAGKSTTLKLLTGIMFPTSGEARVLGLVPWRERTRLALNVASVFGQRSQLWYDLPAADSFELLARIYELPRPDYLARRANLVERFQLGPLLDLPVRKLSLGQRMRCEIAAALLHRPRVLFLDEPTIGLDVLAKQEIRALVRELNRSEGVTVLLTSHDAGDIEQLCERVMLINHGRLLFHDRVSALAARYLRRKRIEVRLAQPAALPAAPAGTRLLAGDPLGFSLELDSDPPAIGPLLAALLGSLPVADIRIEATPLEDIIAALYRELPAGPTARAP